MAKRKQPKSVKSFRHGNDSRRNIPTAEYETILEENHEDPLQVKYKRNRDLDPQFVWRGKDEQDWSSLVVPAPPLFIQEKVHPKVLIDDLRRSARATKSKPSEIGQGVPLDLFADFNGLPDDAERTEFYQHEANWSNRMILGDSLQVMASLAEREGLRGKVQCIYLDPPYGIKFNSNFQWSTKTRNVTDGSKKHITREPEQVKAFRDTWKDGIHSYLTYLRDRLTVARDLLAGTGSIFVQIGDTNVHRVRAIMDEVFGETNFVNLITVRTSSGTTKRRSIKAIADYIIWYAKDRQHLKFRRLLKSRPIDTKTFNQVRHEVTGLTRPMTKAERVDPNRLVGAGFRPYQKLPMHSMGAGDNAPRRCFGDDWRIQPSSHWRYSPIGFQRLLQACRIHPDRTALRAINFQDDYPAVEINNVWTDTGPEIIKSYVVQTSRRIIQRCILMASDPGDLVLDPTCGSATTAYVAEQWGRRWITIDTSRVALALARARMMGARYPYYLLVDSAEGQRKQSEITGMGFEQTATHGNIRQGFVYKRVPHVTLGAIGDNTEIEVIWERWQPLLEAALTDLNDALAGHCEGFLISTGGRSGQALDFTTSVEVNLPSGEVAPINGFMEWEVPNEPGTPWPKDQQKLHTAASAWDVTATPAKRSRARRAIAKLNAIRGEKWTFQTLPKQPLSPWPAAAEVALDTYWKRLVSRQREIDSSIAKNASTEYQYDKPYEDSAIVRVSGPFTVESLSPHRVLGIDEDDELIDPATYPSQEGVTKQDFASIILEQLKISGVQQANKEDRIMFSSLEPWPGKLICAEARYSDRTNRSSEKRAGIFIGPEFGTVARSDLVAVVREAREAGFDIVISCAFNYEAHVSDLNVIGGISVLKARMNADLHMVNDLKNTGKGNLFFVFGEPDIDFFASQSEGGGGQFKVKINGVDIFHPSTGSIRSHGVDGIACWFIDTDYNEESFFVRHAYFIGGKDPYQALKRSLKAEIDKDTWATIHRTVSRPFGRPQTGRIAVKVINHLGDEVMKVFRV